MKTPRKRPNTMFHEFLVLKGKTRQMDELTLARAERVSQRVPYNGSQTEDNEEYEPNSLRAFFASFERHLKKKKLWTLPYERRAIRANSETASVKAKGSKTERQGQQA